MTGSADEAAGRGPHAGEAVHELVNRLDAVASQMSEIHARWERCLSSVEAELYRTLEVFESADALPRGVEKTPTRVRATAERTAAVEHQEPENRSPIGHVLAPVGGAGEPCGTAAQAMDTTRDPIEETCDCGQANEAFNSGVRVGFCWAVAAMLCILVLSHAVRL